MLLLSSGLAAQKKPHKNAKILIGLGVPNLMPLNSLNPPAEIIKTKGLTDYSETLACAFSLPKNEGMKAIKFIKPFGSQHCQATVCQI